MKVNGTFDAAVAAGCGDLTTLDVVSQLRSANIPVAEVAEPWDSRTFAHAPDRGILEPLKFRRPGKSDMVTDRLGSHFPVYSSDAVADTGPAEAPDTSAETILRDVLGLDETILTDLRSRKIIGT